MRASDTGNGAIRRDARAPGVGWGDTAGEDSVCPPPPTVQTWSSSADTDGTRLTTDVRVRKPRYTSRTHARTHTCSHGTHAHAAYPRVRRGDDADGRGVVAATRNRAAGERIRTRDLKTRNKIIRARDPATPGFPARARNPLTSPPCVYRDRAPPSQSHASMVMRKTANASPSSSPQPSQPQVPRKKLSFREPEVVPRGRPRVVLDRADEFDLDEELQVTRMLSLLPLQSPMNTRYTRVPARV